MESFLKSISLGFLKQGTVVAAFARKPPICDPNIPENAATHPTGGTMMIRGRCIGVNSKRECERGFHLFWRTKGKLLNWMARFAIQRVEL